jgi:membrane protease YdiL (CAAX protease family)
MTQTSSGRTAIERGVRLPFAARHPYGFVAALEGMVLAVYLMAGTVAQVAGLTGLWLHAIANGVLVVAVVAILTAMGWWRKVGFRAPRRPRDLLWFLVPFLPVAFNLIPGLEFVDALTVAGLLALALAVGFVEESVFRGMMLTALVPRGAWLAVAVTSVLFGVTHLANVLAGATLAETISQILYAVAIGVAFAALVLRKGVIWPLVFAHFAIDAAYFLQRPGFEFSEAWTVTINAVMIVGFTAYGVYVMRGVPDRSDTRPATPVTA